MIKYARLEDNAVRFNDEEAWHCVNGQWKPLNHAEARHKASLMSEGDFNAMFPGLPDLPPEAFK